MEAVSCLLSLLFVFSLGKESLPRPPPPTSNSQIQEELFLKFIPRSEFKGTRSGLKLPWFEYLCTAKMHVGIFTPSMMVLRWSC